MPILNPYEGEIIHNLKAARFEIHVGKQAAVLQYRLEGDTLLFTSTRVPKALEGRFLGTRLVRAGLDYARQRSLRVRSACWFVDRFIDKNPEYAVLRAEGNK